MIELVKLVRAIEDRYGLPPGTAMTNSKQRRHARPRQLAMYYMRVEKGWSYQRIARAFRRKDHTTVLHACRVVGQLVATYPNLGRDLMEIDAAVSR